MNTYSLKLMALALAGLVAAAPGAKAGGLYDGDDTGYTPRANLDAYCDRNPYDDACGGNDEPQYRPHRHHKKTYNNGHCTALIRAVGKRNLVTAFARNSARFAWRRETRFVHGEQYANWNNAHNAEITCTRYGALKSCEARATPCRY